MIAPKHIIIALASSLLISFSSLTAQVSVATDPVGFISTTIYGNNGSGQRLTLISPTFHAENEVVGLVDGISASSVLVSTSLVSGAYDNGLYYIEVVSNDGTGYWTDIISNSANEVFVNDDLSSFVEIGDTFYIRKHLTIGDLFGPQNKVGLKAGSDISVADNIRVISFSEGISESYIYWYANVPNFEGWYDASFNPSENAIIAPHEGIIVARKASADLQITFYGSVRTNNINFPIESGLNVLSVPSALKRTLSTSGLSDGISAGSNSSEADNIRIIDSNGNSRIYWYSNVPDFEGWYDTSFNSSGDVELMPGTSFIFFRKANNGDAFNLSMFSEIPQN